MNDHPAPLALAPAQHLHLGGHDPLRLRGLEQDAVQPLQHARRRRGLAVHDLGEMGRAYARAPGGLVLAEAVGVHPVPQDLGVDAGGLRGRDPHRGLQRRRDPRLDLHAHVAMTPRHLRHVAVGDAHAVSQVPQAHAQLPGPLPDVAGLPGHDDALAVGALGGRDLRRSLQRRLDPCLDLDAHVLAATGNLRHVAVGHANAVGQVLHGHAQGAGALPDEAALAGHDAALAVDGPLTGDLAQHRRDLLAHLRSPRPATVRNMRQVARIHAHQGRKLLHGEPAPPRRRPELALRARRLLGPIGLCRRCRRHVASSL